MQDLSNFIKMYNGFKTVTFSREGELIIESLSFVHICVGYSVTSKGKPNAFLDKYLYHLTDNFYGAGVVGCDFIIKANDMNTVHCIPYFPNDKGETKYDISIKSFNSKLINFRGWPITE